MQQKFEIMLPLPQHWTSLTALQHLQDKLKEKLNKMNDDRSIDKGNVTSLDQKIEITKSDKESESRSCNTNDKTLLLSYLEVLEYVPKFISTICHARDIEYLEQHHVLLSKQINLLEWLTSRLLVQPKEQSSNAETTTTFVATSSNSNMKEKEKETTNASLDDNNNTSAKASSSEKDIHVMKDDDKHHLLKEKSSPMSVQTILQQYPYSERCWKELSTTDYVVRCLECGTDGTCVMCVDCFTHSPCMYHRHEIMLSGGSARCDCGDEHAWKVESFCSRHRRRSFESVSTEKETVNKSNDEGQLSCTNNINHNLSRICHSVKYNTLDAENVNVQEHIVLEMNEFERGYVITLLRCSIQMITLLLQQAMEANNINKRNTKQRRAWFAKLNKAALSAKLNEEEHKSSLASSSSLLLSPSILSLETKETLLSPDTEELTVQRDILEFDGVNYEDDVFHTSHVESQSTGVPPQQQQMTITNCQELWNEWLNKMLGELAKALKELSTTGQCARTLLAMLWREEAPLHNLYLHEMSVNDDDENMFCNNNKKTNKNASSKSRVNTEERATQLQESCCSSNPKGECAIKQRKEESNEEEYEEHQLEKQESAELCISNMYRMSCLEVLIRFDIYGAPSTKLEVTKTLMDSYANCMHLPIVRISLAGLLLKYSEWLNFHTLKDLAAQSDDDAENNDNGNDDDDNDEEEDALEDDVEDEVWEEIDADDNIGLLQEEELELEQEEILTEQLEEHEQQENDENEEAGEGVNEEHNDNEDDTRIGDTNQNEYYQQNLIDMLEDADYFVMEELPNARLNQNLDENDDTSHERQTHAIDTTEETIEEDHHTSSIRENNSIINNDDDDFISCVSIEEQDSTTLWKILKFMLDETNNNRHKRSQAKWKYQVNDTDIQKTSIVKALACVVGEIWKKERQISECIRHLFPSREKHRWPRFEKSGSLILSKLAFQVFFSKDVDIELVSHPSSMFAHCTDTSIHRQLAGVLFVLGNYAAHASEKTSHSQTPFSFWQERENKLALYITTLLKVKKEFCENDLIDVLRLKVVLDTMSAHEKVTNEMICYELYTDEQDSSKLELQWRKALHKSLAKLHSAYHEVSKHLLSHHAIDIDAYHINHNHWYSSEDVSWKSLMKLTWPQETVLLNCWSRWENFINYTPISSLVSVLSRTAFRAFLLVQLIFTVNAYIYRANHPFHEQERLMGYVDEMYVDTPAPLLVRSFSSSLNGSFMLMQYRISELLRRMALPHTNGEQPEEEEEEEKEQEEETKTQKAEMYKCFVDYVGKDTLKALKANTHFNYLPVVSVTPTDKRYTERRQIFEFMKNVCALSALSNMKGISSDDGNNDKNIAKDYPKEHKYNEVASNTINANNDSCKHKKKERETCASQKTLKPQSSSPKVVDSEMTNYTIPNEALLVDLSTMTHEETENSKTCNNKNKKSDCNDKSNKINQSNRTKLHKTKNYSSLIGGQDKIVNFSQAQLSYTSNLLQEIFYFLTVQLHLQRTQCIDEVNKFEVFNMMQRFKITKDVQLQLFNFESPAVFTRRFIWDETRQKQHTRSNSTRYVINNNHNNNKSKKHNNNIDNNASTLRIVQYNLTQMGHATTFSNYQSHMFKLVLQAWLGVCGNTSTFINDKCKAPVNTSTIKQMEIDGNNEKRADESKMLLTQAEIEYDIRQRLRFTTSSVLRFCHLHYKLEEQETEEEEEEESHESERLRKINSKSNKNGIDALCINDQERPLYTLLCTFLYNYFNTTQTSQDATCNNHVSNEIKIMDNDNNEYEDYMERKNVIELVKAIEGWLDMLVMPFVLSCQIQNALWRRNEFRVVEVCTNYIRQRPFIPVGSDVFILQILAMCYPAPCEFTLRILERFTFELELEKKYVICVNNGDNNIGNLTSEEKEKKMKKQKEQEKDQWVKTYVTGYSNFLRLILTIVLNSSLANTGTHLNMANLAAYLASLLAIRRESFSLLTTYLIDETHHEWVREEMEEKYNSEAKRTIDKHTPTNTINNHNSVFDANGKVMQVDERVEKVLNELAIKQPHKNGTLFELKSAKLWHSFVSLYEVSYIDNDLEVLYENYCHLVRSEQLRTKTQERSNKVTNVSQHIKIPPTRFPTRRTCFLDSSSQYVELVPHVRLLLHTDAVLLPAMYVIVSFAQQIDKNLFANFTDQWPDDTQIMRKTYNKKGGISTFTSKSNNSKKGVTGDKNTKQEIKNKDNEVTEETNLFTHHVRYFANSLLHPITALYLCVKDSVEISYGLLVQEQEKDDEEEELYEEEEMQAQSKTEMRKAKQQNNRYEMLSYAEYVSLLSHEKDAIDTSSANLFYSSVSISGNNHVNLDDSNNNNNNTSNRISCTEKINQYMWQNVKELLQSNFVYDYSFTKEEVLKYLPLKQLTTSRSLPDMLCTKIAHVQHPTLSQNVVHSDKAKEEHVQCLNMQEEEEMEKERKKLKKELPQDILNTHEVNESTIADALRVTLRYFKENPKEDHFSLVDMIDFILRICGFTKRPSQHNNKLAISGSNMESITSAQEGIATTENVNENVVVSAQDRLWQRQRQILERQQKRDRKRAAQLLAKSNAKETTTTTTTNSNTMDEITGNETQKGNDVNVDTNMTEENEINKEESKLMFSPLLRTLLQTISEYVCCVCGVDDSKPLYLLTHVSSSGALPHLHHPRIGNLNNVSMIDRSGKLQRLYVPIATHVYSCSHCAHASCVTMLYSRMQLQYYSGNNRGFAPHEFFCPLCLMTCNALCPLPKANLDTLTLLQKEMWKWSESLLDVYDKFKDERSMIINNQDWYNTLKTNAASSLDHESEQRIVKYEELVRLVYSTGCLYCEENTSAREKVHKVKEKVTWPLYKLLFSELTNLKNNTKEEVATYTNALIFNINKVSEQLVVGVESDVLTLIRPSLKKAEEVIDIILNSLNAIVDQLYTLTELANVGVVISSKQLLTIFALVFSAHWVIEGNSIPLEKLCDFFIKLNEKKLHMNSFIYLILQHHESASRSIEKYMLSALYTSIDYGSSDLENTTKQESSLSTESKANDDTCTTTTTEATTISDSDQVQGNNTINSEHVEYFIPELLMENNTFISLLSQCLKKYHLDFTDNVQNKKDKENNNIVDESSNANKSTIIDDNEHKLFPLWSELVCLTILKLIFVDSTKAHLVLSTSPSFSYSSETAGFTTCSNNNNNKANNLSMAQEVYISALLPANTNSFELRLQSMMHMIEFLCDDTNNKTNQVDTQNEHKCTVHRGGGDDGDNNIVIEDKKEDLVERGKEFQKYSTNSTMLKLFNKINLCMKECDKDESVFNVAATASSTTQGDDVERKLPSFIRHEHLHYFQPWPLNESHSSTTNHTLTINFGKRSALSGRANQSYTEQESLHIITDVLHHPYMYSSMQIAIAEKENKCCECQEKSKELLWCCLCGLAVCVKCVEQSMKSVNQTNCHLIQCCHGVGLFMNVSSHEYCIYDAFQNKKFVMDGSYVDDHEEFRRYRRSYSCLHLNLPRAQRVLKLWMTNNWAIDSTVAKLYMPIEQTPQV